MLRRKRSHDAGNEPQAIEPVEATIIVESEPEPPKSDLEKILDRLADARATYNTTEGLFEIALNILQQRRVELDEAGHRLRDAHKASLSALMNAGVSGVEIENRIGNVSQRPRRDVEFIAVHHGGPYFGDCLETWRNWTDGTNQLRNLDHAR